MRFFIAFIYSIPFFVIAVSAATADEQRLRIATWNISFLAMPGDGRQGYERSQADLDRLARYASELDADIVALQEIDSIAVAQRVFGPQYQIFLSSRDHPQRVGFAVRNTVDLAGPASDMQSIAPPGSRVRYAIDLPVQLRDGRQLRVLSVHLKSHCFEKALDHSSRHCTRLAQQVPLLEKWMDQRARNGDPFVVLGDFNRRFDAEMATASGQTLWDMLDDREPARQTLRRVTQFHRADCWNAKYPLFIDHIVLGKEASYWVIPGSFQQIVYQEDDSFMTRLSDHCPISVDLAIR